MQRSNSLYDIQCILNRVTPSPNFSPNLAETLEPTYMYVCTCTYVETRCIGGSSVGA